MAKGDSIVSVITASGSYQPAAGVSVLISAIACPGASDVWAVGDPPNNVALVTAGVNLNAKVYITNSNYMIYTKTTGNAYVGGVQIS